MTSFEDIFQFRKKKCNRCWGQVNRRLENQRNTFWGQNVCEEERNVPWGIVMMEHPFVCNAWFHANDPYLGLSRTSLQKTWLTLCTGGTHSLWTILLLPKKQIRIDFIFQLLRKELTVYHFSVCFIVLGSYLKTHDSSSVITLLKKSYLLAMSRRSSHLSLDCPSIVKFFGPILVQAFRTCKSSVKIWWTVNLLNCALDIPKVKQRSDLTRLFIL